MYDTETIFWAENATHRLEVTVAPEYGADFADIEPEVKVRHVDREEYTAVRDFDPDAHKEARLVHDVLAGLDVDTVTLNDGTEIDVRRGYYSDSDGTTYSVSAEYGRMFLLSDGGRDGYVVGEVSDPSDYGDFARFAAHCGRLWRGEIGVYYVRAVVQAKCGACNTWHNVGEDSTGHVVDTPDTATWQEVARNALHAAGLDLETFDFGA